MAVRDDQGKLDWSLLPVEVIEEMLKVLMVGAKKYGKHNWRRPPYLSPSRIANSLKRHQAAFEKGERYDDSSGLLHTAHVAVNAAFQLYYDLYDLFGEEEDTLPDNPGGEGGFTG